MHALIYHIARFLKSGILIYNSEAPNMAEKQEGEEHSQL